MRTRPTLICALASIGLGGCVTKGDPFLLKFQPAEGPLPDGFWEAAAKTEDDHAQDTWTWVVPLLFQHKYVRLEDEKDRVWFIDIDAVNPGLLLLPTLPLFVSADYGRWSRSGEFEQSGFRWTPLWMWDYAVGDPPVRFEARGFPLVYGSVVIDSQETIVEIDHSLLTLGPFRLSGRSVERSESNHTWAFFPLLLGGVGGWLWTSLHSETPGPGSYTKLDVHGPIDGLLGYIAWEDRHQNGEGREATTLAAGGVLWYSRSERDDDGEVRDARHGPLWGMFGYGKRSGENALFFLWLPIVF